MENPDIKLKKDEKRALRAKIWKSIKVYTFILLISFLIYKSYLQDITTVNLNNQQIIELCLDREGIENEYNCKRSIMFKNLNLF